MKNFIWFWIKCVKEPDYYGSFVDEFKQMALKQRQECEMKYTAMGYIEKICPKCGDEFWDHKYNKETLCHKDRENDNPVWTQYAKDQFRIRREKELRYKNDNLNP